MKTGDFGLAVQLEHASSKRSSTCGTSLYMAPEVYEEEGCLKSDVWSLGISLVEMAEGKNPYLGYSVAEVMKEVLWKPPPSLSSSSWSSNFVDFVKQCLIKDVEKRPSVDELMRVSKSERSDP